MRKFVLNTAVAAVVVIASSFAGALSASADPTGNVTVNGQQSDPLRAVFHEDRDGGGYKMFVRSSIICTSGTDNIDIYRTSMPAGWNDAITSVQDTVGCDIKLYMDYYKSPFQTGWINTSAGISNLATTYNDKTSAYALS